MRRAFYAILLVQALSAAARADGAFPDSFALFAPADQPNALRLATNFGLVVSSDDAQTWHYVCENAIIAFATLYTQGPDDALYAVSTLGLVGSRDGGCSWTTAGGSLTLSAVDDAFADPSDGMHLLAIARVVGDGGIAGNTTLYQSHDGGTSFGAPIYAPPATQTLTGVEIAKSDPRTVYLTMYESGPHPYVARSDDGGTSFTVIDEGALGSRFPRLIAVDPTNPKRLFLRLGGGPTGDDLGISEDGGATVVSPLTVPGQMTAFLLRSDGTILLGGNSGSAFRSTDGGKSFSAWPVGLHLRGLAERAGRLYAVGDDIADHGALWQSDDGDHFTPILHFRDLEGPLECGQVATTCAAPWASLQPLIQPNIDGGAPADMSRMVSGGSGCGCRLTREGGGVVPLLALLLLVILLRRSKIFGALLLTFYCSAAYAHVGAVVSLARFTDPPPLLTAPDGGVTGAAIQTADASFDVAWNDGDMDPTGRYFFYYSDRQPPSGASTADVVKTATPIPEGSAGIWTSCDCIDGNGVFCPDAGVRDCRDDFIWDTRAVPPGSYWIIAVDNDPPYYLYSVAESPLRIGHAGTPPPGALFITPNGIGAADASYTVTWVAAGDAPLQFDLAWGQNVEPQVNDAPTPIAANLTATDEGGGRWSYLWDTSALPNGDVFVQLTVHDAGGRTSLTDSLNLKIFHPSQLDAAPAAGHDLSMPAVKTGGSCEVSSDAPACSALFAGALLALLFGLAVRSRSHR